MDLKKNEYFILDDAKTKINTADRTKIMVGPGALSKKKLK